MEQYNNLMAAARILRLAASDEYRASDAFTPAWEMLTRARLYIEKQAKQAMLGGEVK